MFRLNADDLRGNNFLGANDFLPSRQERTFIPLLFSLLSLKYFELDKKFFQNFLNF